MSEQASLWESHPNQFIRIAGRDQPASAVLEQALNMAAPRFWRAAQRLTSDSPVVATLTDYAQIDPMLPLVESVDPVSAPSASSGYAGLTEAQRGFFYRWLHTTDQSAPPAYLRLYLAHLETFLFLGEKETAAARGHLLELLETSAWASFPELTRTALLAAWLAHDDRYLTRVIQRGHFAPTLMGTALGWQALLGHALRGDEALAAQRIWRNQNPDNLPAAAIVQLNIDSLATTLGSDPLRYALNQITPSLPEDVPPETDLPWRGAWTTWRCAHRDLSIDVPNPDLRATLAPLVNELVQTAQRLTQIELETMLALAAEEEADDDAADDGVEPSTPNWHLVLEFSESRSQFYDHVVFIAQKQPNYVMLMDEGRQIVHRLLYQKRNIRQFWRLWDYVQKWSNVRVYVNGQEIDKWKIWPYSPHMR